MLAAAKVNQFYGGSHTLWDIDLEVPKGDCLCLMGRNGVGKTTLLKVIMGLLPSTSGEIKFGDTTLTGAAPRVARAGRDRLRAAGTRDLPVAHRRGEPAHRARTARHGARDPGAGAARCSRSSRRCCAGVAAISRAGSSSSWRWGGRWRCDPQLLILDEPTEGIQPNVVHEIGDVILRLVDEGVTVLLVEQKLKFARRVGRSFCILDRGHVVASGEISGLTDELVHRHLTV